MTVASKPVVVLLVDDSEADCVLFDKAVRKAGAGCVVHTAANGEEGLSFLRRGAPRPDVVVLDIDMPGMNGHEMLKKMMSFKDLRSIPVAVLTTSTSEAHICGTCPPGQCLYFIKPSDFMELVDIVRQVVAHGQA